MKKLHKNIFISILTLIFIIIGHYFIYLWNRNYEVPFIEIYASTPIDLPNIKLEKEIRPTYFSPFQKLQYIYTDIKNPNNIIIEENKNYFKGKMEIIQGKDIVEKYHKESGHFFITGHASNEYPSPLFFIVQYILMFTFIVFTCKTYKELKIIKTQKDM